MFYQSVYSRDCATEINQNESARISLSEDENTINNSDLNAEETRDVIAELMYSQDRLKKLNIELERSVELGDEQNTALHTENTALSNQVKSLKQALHDSEKLGEELDDARRLRTEQDSDISSQKNQIRQLEMENKALKEHNKNITSEMSCILPERAKDKSKMADLSTALQAVQQQMEELRLNLDTKDSMLHEELRVKIKELEAELEETHVWWRLRAEDLVKGVQAAGTFTLGFLLPLGVVASMVPICYDSEMGMTCGDVLWTTARYLMEPYSRVHYIGMPPV